VNIAVHKLKQMQREFDQQCFHESTTVSGVEKPRIGLANADEKKLSDLGQEKKQNH